MQPGPRFYSLLLFFFLVPVSVISQEKDIRVRIVQEDSVYELDADLVTVSLFKEGFKIQVFLQHIKGIYVFASLTDSMFTLQDIVPVPGFSDLPDRLISEDNKERELTVSNDGWCYWSHDPRAGSIGFNKKVVSLDSGRMLCIKSIKELYLLPSQKTVKLKDIREPLYIFFVAVNEVDGAGKPIKELARRRVKIDWIDED